MSDEHLPGATNEKTGVIDEPPPFLGTWPRVYSAVLLILLTLIVLFWVFGEVATP